MERKIPRGKDEGDAPSHPENENVEVVVAEEEVANSKPKKKSSSDGESSKKRKSKKKKKFKRTSSSKRKSKGRASAAASAYIETIPKENHWNAEIEVEIPARLVPEPPPTDYFPGPPSLHGSIDTSTLASEEKLEIDVDPAVYVSSHPVSMYNNNVEENFQERRRGDELTEKTANQQEEIDTVVSDLASIDKASMASTSLRLTAMYNNLFSLVEKEKLNETRSSAPVQKSQKQEQKENGDTNGPDYENGVGAIGMAAPPPTLQDIEREFGTPSIEPEEEVDRRETQERKQRSSMERNDDDEKKKARRLMLLGIFFIIVLLLSILGITAAILAQVRKNNDSSKDKGDGLPTFAPNVSPTPPGTLVPSTEGPPSPPPTLSSSCPQIFQSIANTPGATQLEGLDGNFWCGTHVCQVLVELPFEFQCLDGLEYTDIYISPDAAIGFYPIDYFDDVCASDCGGINVARSYDPHEVFEGEIWTLKSKESFKVSWEKMSFDGSQNKLMNAQVTLYPNGDLDMCWGEGRILDSFVIYASIWDDTTEQDLNFPATGHPFDEGGSSEEWPINQCQFFRSSIPGWVSTVGCTTNTCETPWKIGKLPFYDNNVLSAGQDNWATACPKFSDSEFSSIVWYEFRGDGLCSCLELRSNDNAFIAGVYKTSASSGDGCDELSCIADTDFTSETIVWRTAVNQMYKIAVSVLPGPGPDSGFFTLTVLNVGNICSAEPDSSFLSQDSCEAIE